MTDTRVRVLAPAKAINLEQLAEEIGAALCGPDPEILGDADVGQEIVVADPDAGITEAELLAAIDAHVPRPQPLGQIGVVATLNAVLGVWPLADAANVVQLPEQALIDEALAWAACEG